MRLSQQRMGWITACQRACYFFTFFMLCSSATIAQSLTTADWDLYSFGVRGQIKMLYDRRQRPQAIKVDENVHLVYNAAIGKPHLPPKAATQPMAATFNLKARNFSDPYVLGPSSDDHHDGPVIWVDANDHFHVFIWVL